MIDIPSTQDVPPGVMDLLRIFLAASSRGEQAVFILETRRRERTTKFRSGVETGTPAPTYTQLNNKKNRKNPARARRSKLRLEEFMKRKVENKKQAESSQAAETTNRMVMELAKDEDRPENRSVGADLPSPIPQVDGAGKDFTE